MGRQAKAPGAQAERKRSTQWSPHSWLTAVKGYRAKSARGSAGQSPVGSRAKKAAAKGRVSSERQSFQRTAGESRSAELSAFLKKGSCREVTPTFEFPRGI